MANDVLNPRGQRLSALQALRASNEFFDLQLVHATAAEWLTSPSAADARALLSLASCTLLLLPAPAALSRWRSQRATCAIRPG